MKKDFSIGLLVLLLLIMTCIVLVVISESQMPTTFISSGLVAIISAVIGAILVGAVTFALLKKQTESQSELQEKLISQQSKKDREKEIEVKVFEEKLTIYKDFLSKLHEIVKDDQISDDEVKELIFQISYIAMHTRSDRVNKVLVELRGVIEMIGNKDRDQLAQNILKVVLVLQQELYRQQLSTEVVDTKIFSGAVSDIEDTAGVVASNDRNAYGVEAQTYFWVELIRQLKSMGYSLMGDEWSEGKIASDVKEYYAKARNRSRYFGFGIKVYTSKEGRDIGFYVEIENDYYYGFAWVDKPNSTEALAEITKQVSAAYKSNDGWGGWRWPDNANDATRHDLNFWKFTPQTSMERLLDLSKREAFVKEIAQEMDEQIKKFKELINQKQL